MRLWKRVFAFLSLLFLLSACTGAGPTATPDSASPTQVPASSTEAALSLTSTGSTPLPQADCPVTEPNGSTPPGEEASPNYHGNGSLWTILWPEGRVVVQPDQVEKDGWLGMKFPWWRGVEGSLSITGRRLDAPAEPLRASIPDGYGTTGFQATGIAFPGEGCWEITGRAGEAELTFVTWVVRAEE